MNQNQRHQIQRLVTFLSRESAQSMPEFTVVLTVISGSSVLPFTRLSGSTANAITAVVRLIV